MIHNSQCRVRPKEAINVPESGELIADARYAAKPNRSNGGAPGQIDTNSGGACIERPCPFAPKAGLRLPPAPPAE